MHEPRQAPSPGAALPSGGGTALAAAIVGWCITWYIAYGWAGMVRLDVHDDARGLTIGLALLIALLVLGFVRPYATALLVLLVIPLFGNHPGGRLMELVNLPLAASAAGLALLAHRHGRRVPRGPIWTAATLYAASALVAVVPSVAGMLVQAAVLNHWPTALVEGLTAPADNPLYSLSSLAGVTLCVAWSAACHWSAPPSGFYRAAIRVLVYPFFVVVGLGILNHFGFIDLVSSYLLRIDPRRPDVSGFQSIFWNPGWFAWYFVMAFAIAVGFLWSAPPRERYLVTAWLVASYAFSFLNPQRGGLIALHGCLAAAGWVLVRTSGQRRLARRGIAIASVAILAAVFAAYAFELIPRALGSSLYRLVESPAEVVTSDSIRLKLWTVALQMWREAPLFGIGEGSFGWRFEEYAPPGTALYTIVHGDAHSTWLQILATRGLFGVVALIGLLWAIGRVLRIAWTGPRPGQGLQIGAALSLFAFLVYSTVQGMFYLQGIQILFWFLVTTIAASAPAAGAAGLVVRWRPAAIAALVLFAVSVQAWTARPLFARARAVIDVQPRGFYGVEQDDGNPRAWRWSAGREGTLCLQPLGPTVEVRLAAGDPRPGEYPKIASLKVNGVEVDTFPLDGPEEVSRFVRVPWSPAAPRPGDFGECTGRGDDVRLTVSVDRTWNPLADGLGPDPRMLGLRVFEPVYP